MPKRGVNEGGVVGGAGLKFSVPLWKNVPGGPCCANSGAGGLGFFSACAGRGGWVDSRAPPLFTAGVDANLFIERPASPKGAGVEVIGGSGP